MDKVNSILVILAHPARSRSRVNSCMREAVENLAGLTFVDLYEEYPEFLIDVKREQTRLLEHQLLVFQHPFYWYSSPPLLKEWLDVVLEAGFAYGEGGTKLRGLDFLQVISTGAPAEAYQAQGYHGFTVDELLRPFQATARLCGWNYHEPILVQGARALDESYLQQRAKLYRETLMKYLSEGSLALKGSAIHRS